MVHKNIFINQLYKMAILILFIFFAQVVLIPHAILCVEGYFFYYLPNTIYIYIYIDYIMTDK